MSRCLVFLGLEPHDAKSFSRLQTRNASSSGYVHDCRHVRLLYTDSTKDAFIVRFQGVLSSVLGSQTSIVMPGVYMEVRLIGVPSQYVLEVRPPVTTPFGGKISVTNMSDRNITLRLRTFPQTLLLHLPVVMVALRLKLNSPALQAIWLVLQPRILRKSTMCNTNRN